ncbi:MAG: heat-inducible transcriptional repressor HrcA [Synechococcales bacterium]|nr:heat-inducible transcriptional repressor HrcA [Synechococcales bacterium]
MPNAINLNNRQQQVLWATVKHYIATAEPVGSEALVKEYNLSVSSATIRNAMGFLEKEGLLYQPHPSAGRIPSDSGYRIYVDQLMQPAIEFPQITQALYQHLQKNWSLETLLRGAAQILATLSGYITLVTLPLQRHTEIRHVQLVQVAAQRIMLIVVTDSYETQSILVDLESSEEETDADLLGRELQVLSNFLNDELSGKGLAELQTLDWGELGQEFERYSRLLSSAMGELDRRLSQAWQPTQIMVSGISDVLRQPEFSELQQFQAILQLLEMEQHQLVPLIVEPMEGDRKVSIWIGTENPLEPMRSCTLISSTYHRSGMPSGSVSLLGPTRMNYETAIALVENTADYLSDRLSGT